MGDPKKHRKKYHTPGILWNTARIEEEKELSREYGFKNKKEIWKLKSMVSNFARKAKDLIAAEGKQTEIETKHLLDKLANLGLLEPNSQLDKVLDLNVRSLAERRLQTQVQQRGLAKSVKQARQFITHRHILIGDKVITAPSYLVSKKEEALVKFIASSALSNPEHPERALDETTKTEIKKVVKKAEEKTTKKPIKKTEVKKAEEKTTEEPVKKTEEAKKE